MAKVIIIYMYMYIELPTYRACSELTSVGKQWTVRPELTNP